MNQNDRKFTNQPNVTLKDKDKRLDNIIKNLGDNEGIALNIQLLILNALNEISLELKSLNKEKP